MPLSLDLLTFVQGSVNVKPQKGWSVPAAITGAVESVTRGLAVDLAPVRVNVICPGLVDTEVKIQKQYSLYDCHLIT